MLGNTTNAEMPRILVFDSGVGGLSVMHEINQRLPQAEIIFACDNAAFPYGTHSESALLSRVLKVMDKLIQKTAPDLVVIACNTASTLVLSELRQRYDLPFVGVVPAIKPAAALSKTKVIGLLATPATTQRAYTDTLIRDFAASHHIIRIGSSELVYAAETKLRGGKIDINNLNSILAPFRDEPDLDTVVLACTHFPLLLDELQPLLAASVQWVDSSEAIARRVASLLTQNSSTPRDPSEAINSTNPGIDQSEDYRTLMTAPDKKLAALRSGNFGPRLAPIEIVSI